MIDFNLMDWLFGEKDNREARYLEKARDDFNYRCGNYSLVKRFLKGMQERVKYRRELLMEDFIRHFDGQIRRVLMEVGWMPLDPIYSDDQEWLDAVMDFSDQAIELAMNRYLQPFNRDWCYGLAEDFREKYTN